MEPRAGLGRCVRRAGYDRGGEQHGYAGRSDAKASPGRGRDPARARGSASDAAPLRRPHSCEQPAPGGEACVPAKAAACRWGLLSGHLTPLSETASFAPRETDGSGWPFSRRAVSGCRARIRTLTRGFKVPCATVTLPGTAGAQMRLGGPQPGAVSPSLTARRRFSNRVPSLSDASAADRGDSAPASRRLEARRSNAVASGAIASQTQPPTHGRPIKGGQRSVPGVHSAGRQRNHHLRRVSAPGSRLCTLSGTVCPPATRCGLPGSRIAASAPLRGQHPDPQCRAMLRVVKNVLHRRPSIRLLRVRATGIGISVEAGEV